MISRPSADDLEPLHLPSPLNEGRSRNSGDTSGRSRSPSRESALNEGRSRNSGDTSHGPVAGSHVDVRSTKAGAGTPATPREARTSRALAPSLNEGRSRNSGDTCMNSRERTSRSCIAQRRPEPELRRHVPTIGEQLHAAQRSTKAGAGTPATPLIVMINVEPVKLRCIGAFKPTPR